MKLKNIILALTLTLWPFSLYLKNTPQNYISYLVPTLILLLGYTLFKKGKIFFWTVLLLIPFVSPKLAALPLAVSLLSLFFRRNKYSFLFIISSLILSFIFIKPLWGQTVFKFDYEAKQQIIRNTYLYPNVLLARLSQNKVKIITDKLNNNFFAITDPANYFFAFHPREGYVENQNLDKYPFLSLPFLLFGLYCLKKNKDKTFIIPVLVASVLTLSVLTNFDRQDFTLYLPLSLIIIDGINIFEKRWPKVAKYYWPMFIIFSLQEIVKLLITKS